MDLKRIRFSVFGLFVFCPVGQMVVSILLKQDTGHQEEVHDTLHQNLGSPLFFTAVLPVVGDCCFAPSVGRGFEGRLQCAGTTRKSGRNFKEILSSREQLELSEDLLLLLLSQMGTLPLASSTHRVLLTTLPQPPQRMVLFQSLSAAWLQPILGPP